MGSTGAPPLEWSVADPLITHPSHMCYHVKFGCSASNGERTNRRELHKLGSAGSAPLQWGADLGKYSPPLYVLSFRIWSL